MGHLTLDHYPEWDLVVFTGRGTLTGAQVIDANRWREARCPTGRTLWDLRLADMSEIALPELQRIVEGLVEQAQLAGGRRTALVMDDELNLPIVRLYAQIAEYRQLPIDSRIFEGIGPAWDWLGIETPPDGSSKVPLSF